MRDLSETAPAVNIRLPHVGWCPGRAAARTAFIGSGFSDRIITALSNAGLGTRAKLLAVPAEDLRGLPGLGKKGFAALLAWRATALLAGKGRRAA